MNLFAELKRRNVIRMAVMYPVCGWVLVQVAETVLPIFQTPDWVLQALVVLVALGLVPALVFSWIYDFNIGAHAAVLEYRLLTRDARRYETYFSNLTILSP